MSLSGINKTFLLLSSMLILLSFNNFAYGEPEYDAQGQLIPLGAEKKQGTLNKITPTSDGTGLLIINDTPYRVNSTTKYITSYGATSSLSAFKEGQFVGFYHIESLVTKIWPDKDPEETTTTKVPVPQKAPAGKGITKKNGVWTN